MSFSYQQIPLYVCIYMAARLGAMPRTMLKQGHHGWKANKKTNKQTRPYIGPIYSTQVSFPKPSVLNQSQMDCRLSLQNSPGSEMSATITGGQHFYKLRRTKGLEPQRQIGWGLWSACADSLSTWQPRRLTKWQHIHGEKKTHATDEFHI